MNYRKAWSRNAVWLAGTATLFGSWSCSVLYDFNTSQCDKTEDCLNQGPQFVHSICRNHVCVQTSSATGGGTATGGSNSAGETSGMGGNTGSVGGSSAVGGSGTGDVNGGSTSSGGSQIGGDTSVGGVSSTSDTSLPAGGSTTGGQTGVGGIAGGGGVGGIIATGGTAAGGETGSGTGGVQPTGGATGTGGTTGPECTTNNECITKHVDQPYICKAGSCVLLTSPNCPVLIPAQSSNPSYNYLSLLKNAAPIIVGGFANMSNAADPHTTQAILNWDLAFDEFNTKTLGGLAPYDTGGQKRPLVGLICQGRTDVSGLPKDLKVSMDHLTKDIGATSVLSTLAAADLYEAWNTTALEQNVFFMNTGSANLSLVNTSNGGMLWHMLGDPHVLAATVVATVHQMEPYIYQRRKANFDVTGVDDPDAEPLRVTMVYSNHSTMIDLHDVLTNPDAKHPEVELAFNDKSFLQNKTDGNFRDVQIQSVNVVNPPDVTAGTAELEGHPPHLVLAMATSEFPSSVMQTLEAWWGATGATTGLIRPYYVMSHLTYNTSALTDRTKTYFSTSPPLHQRVVGVNYAQTQDQHSKDLYGLYLSRLQSANSSTTLSLTGTENYYDGAYFLLYSIAAAARQYRVPAAINISNGFQSRVIAKNGTSVDIGPLSIQTTVNDLLGNTPSNWNLWGTMGPANFDTLLGTGANVSLTSAWCVQQTSASTAGVYQPDGLIYDVASQAFVRNSSGIPTCLQNYCPPDADAGVNTCPESY